MLHEYLALDRGVEWRQRAADRRLVAADSRSPRQARWRFRRRQRRQAERVARQPIHA